MSAHPLTYDVPDEVLVYLIGKTLDGRIESRQAAAFILECLRLYRTPEETEACLADIEGTGREEVAANVRRLATGLGLFR